MYAPDFEYDGQFLSDFGFIVCKFDGSSGVDTSDTGSVITFNTVSRNSGKIHSLTSTTYDDCITAEFDICKDPCEWDDIKITRDEYRDLVRWLNRREFLKFRAIDPDDTTSESCFFDASFNIAKVIVNDELYGLRLSMETNRPFGYGQEQTVVLEITDVGESYKVNDLSDEIGYIYPVVTVKCDEDGTLTLTNSRMSSKVVVENVSSGETITFNGDTLQISTSDATHTTLYNDFNYIFPQLINSYTDSKNWFSSSIACTVTITYTPVIKDTV